MFSRFSPSRIGGKEDDDGAHGRFRFRDQGSHANAQDCANQDIRVDHEHSAFACSRSAPRFLKIFDQLVFAGSGRGDQFPAPGSQSPGRIKIEKSADRGELRIGHQHAGQ
jgi:hypothetical protein